MNLTKSTIQIQGAIAPYQLKRFKMRVEKSFLKWVGGKGRLIPQLLPHLTAGKRLIEPFVGAGNVFINTYCESYILADSNHDLINVYSWLKNDLATVVNETEKLFESEIDFYDLRDQFNHTKNRCNPEQAARFIWLNRHCFNGVCRYNKKGKFNVPKGKHKTIYFPKQELINFSNRLVRSDVSLIACDFTSTISTAKTGDIIYCDPPYLSKNKDSFVGYTACGFDYSQTEVLANVLYEAVLRGATAIISNHNNETVRDIFSDFEIHEIEAPRSVAANGCRKSAKEIIGILTPDMV